MLDLDELEQCDPSPDGDELMRQDAKSASDRLRDSMFNIRRDACKALAKVGKFAEPYLAKLKELSDQDDDLDVRKAARTAIRELREQGVVFQNVESTPDPKQQQVDVQKQVSAERAGKMLNARSWNARKDACKRLSTVGKAAEPYLPRLKELLEDERPEVQKAAQAALKTLNDAGLFLPEPEPVELPPVEIHEAPVGGEVGLDGDADFLYNDVRPAPRVPKEVDLTPEWWESLPGGPTWDPEENPTRDALALMEERAANRIIPKEEKVEYNKREMMRETAQSAGEELRDNSVAIRREAVSLMGSLGKYAKPYLEDLQVLSVTDLSDEVRLAAKYALQQLQKEGIGKLKAEQCAEEVKPEAKVNVVAPSPHWTGPIAKFRIFEEVLPMVLETGCVTPAEVIKIWEQWGIHGASRIRFLLQPQEEAAEETTRLANLNPRLDPVPLAPAVVKLEARVGSVLHALAVALRRKVGAEDAYREERLNRRRDPRSKLWIEGPPVLESRRAAPPPVPVPEGPRDVRLPQEISQASGTDAVEVD